MSTINRLSSVDVLQPGDQIPVWDSSNGDTRKASMSTLLAFVESYFADPDYSTRIVAPNTDYFTVDIGNTGDSIWMIVNPVLNFSTGAITLPSTAYAVNDQEITVVFTAAVVNFSIASSGATVLGAPVSINGYDSFRVRYNASQQTWYTLDTTGDGAGGVSQIVRQDFTGDGTTTTFTLTTAPSGLGNELQIFIDGVYQERSGYAVTGSNVVFSEAPPSLSTIEVLGWSVTLGAETSANLVSYTPAGTGAVVTTVQTKLRESVSVKDFGAGVGIDYDRDTAAFQAAVDAVGRGEVIIPAGIYYLNDSITIGERISIIGEGQQATIIYFAPGVDNAPCFWFTNGAAVCNQNRISGLAIIGSGADLKIGIRADDTSFLAIENISMSNFANESIGIQLRGREFTIIEKCQLGYVDRPITIEPNVNGGFIDCDHLHISDLYSISTAGHHHITIAPDLALSNFLVDGTNAWVNGDGGIYWYDLTGTSGGLNISVNNVRLEGQTNAAAYLFYIIRGAAYNYNVNFSNIYGGLFAKGYKFRNCGDVTISNSMYVNNASNESLDIDDTVWRTQIQNCMWQSGTTYNLTGQRLLFGTQPVYGLTVLPNNALYEASTGANAGNGTITSVLLSGDSVPGRSVRISDLKIEPGTAGSSIKCTLTNIFNGDTIALTDNILAGTTVGNFSLDASGSILSISDAGISGTIVAVLDNTLRNSTGTLLYSPAAYQDGTSISYSVRTDASGTPAVWSALGGQSYTSICYITTV
jgi:hypothetical protein